MSDVPAISTKSSGLLILLLVFIWGGTFSGDGNSALTEMPAVFGSPPPVWGSPATVMIPDLGPTRVPPVYNAADPRRHRPRSNLHRGRQLCGAVQLCSPGGKQP